MIKHIAKIKKLPKYRHWYKLDAQAIQDVVERIDRAYTLFFRNRKKHIKASPPKFQKFKRYKSFTLKQHGYKLYNSNRIKIGRSTFKYSKSRSIEGKVKMVTVKRDRLGDIYVFVVTDHVESRIVSHTGEIVGFDFGLKTFLVGSNKHDIESPLFFQQNRSKIRKAHKRVSSKVKYSNNRNKAKDDLNRAYRKVSNQRSDFQWKLANELTNKYDVICLETLNIAGMKRLWGKKISDLSFSASILKLKYLASAKGKRLVFINQWEPSSKTCSACGYIYKNLSLKERSWSCPECGTDHDRDRNASYNILRVGASTLGLGDVRPEAILAFSA